MAYSAPAAPIRTPRGVEYEALADITRSLKKASVAGRTEFRALVEALHRNRQLWTILAANVADPANALPPPLRAQLFYLYEFTTHHTAEVLAGRGDAGALIDVNTAIMQGLRAREPES